LVKQINVIQDVQLQFSNPILVIMMILLRASVHNPTVPNAGLTYNEKSALYNSAHTDGILVHERVLNNIAIVLKFGPLQSSSGHKSSFIGPSPAETCFPIASC